MSSKSRSGHNKNKKSQPSDMSTSPRVPSPVYDFPQNNASVEPSSPAAIAANVNNIADNNDQYDARFNKLESTIADLATSFTNLAAMHSQTAAMQTQLLQAFLNTTNSSSLPAIRISPALPGVEETKSSSTIVS